MAKILIVDDEPDMVELVVSRLEASGYEVITASDGKEAIAQAKSDRPDLILMDVMMPNMTGGDAVRVLKDDDDTKDIPVIFFTGVAGHQQHGEEAAGINIGGEMYETIPKPYDPYRLLATISKYL